MSYQQATTLSSQAEPKHRILNRIYPQEKLGHLCLGQGREGLSEKGAGSFF